VYTDVEDVHTPGEFADKLFVKVGEALPAITKARSSLMKHLKQLGITKIGAGGFGVEFEIRERQWIAVLQQVVAALDRMDDRVVLVFDELPQMLTNIAKRGEPLVARQVLDTLREIRQTQRQGRVTMIFTGSIGLHHVVRELTETGGSWAPINDMAVIDVQPLEPSDAIDLARELLINEGVDATSIDELSAAVAAAVDNAPFYIHQVVVALTNRPRSSAPATAAVVEEIVVDRINDPQDPWKFDHFIHRLVPYYGDDAPLAGAVLDTVAIEGEVVFAHLRRLLATKIPVTEADLADLQGLMQLLQNDYYLAKSPDQTFRFRSRLLARAWRARRFL
jgi:hypothetical protein